MKKNALLVIIALSIFLSACSGKSSISEAAGSSSEEVDNEVELQAYYKDESEDKLTDNAENDTDYRKMYANEESIDSARKILLEIPEQLSDEEIEDGDYIKAKFMARSIEIGICNNEGELLANGYSYPDSHSSNLWFHYPIDTNELYDENGRLYIRNDGFDSTIYKYDEEDRVVEEETIYNYFDAEYLAERILDDISFDEYDNAYIDDIADAVYGLEDIIYDDLEYDYERIRYEYDEGGNCIRKLSYGGAEDDTLNWECNYTYEGDKLVRESENDGWEYIDYEYEGETLAKECKYRDDSLYSTKKYYYDPEKKTKLVLEEFTDPETENELTGFIYLKPDNNGSSKEQDIIDNASDDAQDKLSLSPPKNFTSQGTGIIEDVSDIRKLYDALEIIEVDDSTCFSAIGYSEINEIFYCRFRDEGTEYIYLNVPKYIYQELMSADSKGGFYNRQIKPDYDCMKIGK